MRGDFLFWVGDITATGVQHTQHGICWSLASKADEWVWAEFHLEAHEGVTVRLTSIKVWVQSTPSLTQKFPRRWIHFRLAQGGPSFPPRPNLFSVSSLDLLKTTCFISMSDSLHVCSRYSEICDHSPSVKIKFFR